ncbi:hypothetical protein ACG10_22720 (plasmid) [Azotobacter chroococcum]|nr:hypothetical protein ACG10_22720 [Azotobacter chroococcum]
MVIAMPNQPKKIASGVALFEVKTCCLVLRLVSVTVHPPLVWTCCLDQFPYLVKSIIQSLIGVREYNPFYVLRFVLLLRKGTGTDCSQQIQHSQ